MSNMRATPLRGFRAELRPKRLTRRPRLSTHVEREGQEVLLAISDGQHGFTARLSPGGAAALGLHLHHAGSASNDDEPIYAVDVVGELESCNQEDPEQDR